MIVSYRPYRYVKATPGSRSKSRVVKAFALILVVGGAVTLAATFLPALEWQISASKTKELVLPVAVNRTSKEALVLGTTTQTSSLSTTSEKRVTIHKLADGFSYFGVTNSIINQDSKKNHPASFIVSIPKIGLENAQVIANSVIFEQNLGHLPGTAFPGEVGNMFITGHSSLPQFYSPKNYKTIFSYLPKLDILDEIQVVANKRTYTYSVEKTFVTDPENISVIDPPDPFGKYLTLMTCVPPGMNTKRLIVLARLVE